MFLFVLLISIHTRIFFFSSLAGYETAFTFKEITEDVLRNIEEFGRKIPQAIENYASKLNAKLKEAQKQNLINLFLGMHASNVEEFHFKMADKILVLNIVKLINEELVRSNNSYDIFEQQFEQTQIIKSTSIGNIFGDFEQKPLKKLEKKKKNRTDSNVFSAINDGLEGVEETEKAQETEESQDLVKIQKEIFEYADNLLRLSFCVQMKILLTDYTKRNTKEMKFLEKCGMQSIETFVFSIFLRESDLQLLVEQVKVQKEENNEERIQLLAHIPCYCTRDSLCSITAYFRPNSKFTKVLKSRPNLEIASKDVSTCWLLSNFKRHLNSHSKLYSEETIEPSATGTKLNSIDLNY
jgi:hypothetical protein